MFAIQCIGKAKELHHADKHVTTVKHRFDNKKSLSHVKTADAFLKQIRTYEDFALNADDAETRIAMCKIVAETWSSQRAEKLFGLRER